MRIGLFYSIYAFHCILNVLLECIELFNTVECILYMRIFLLESIDLILAHHASTAGIICPHIMFFIMSAYLTEAYLLPCFIICSIVCSVA